MNSFFDISITLAKDFIACHILSQYPQIPRVDDPILALEIIFEDFMPYPMYDVLEIP